MRSPNVQEFCQRLWDLRESAPACLPCGATISRMLARAVADDVYAVPGYDPFADRRVEWANCLARESVRRSRVRPYAAAELEWTAGFLLDRQPEPVAGGRERAAGGAAA